MNMTDEEIIAYWRGAYDRMAARSIEDGAKIAKLEAQNERLLKINDDHVNSVNTYIGRVSALVDEIEAFRSALRPSAETKAAYIGEVRQRVHMTDPSGEEYSQEITVDWTSMKSMMTLIREFAEAKP